MFGRSRAYQFPVVWSLPTCGVVREPYARTQRADGLDGDPCSTLLSVDTVNRLLQCKTLLYGVHIQSLSSESRVAAWGATAQPIMLKSQPRSTARTEPFVLEYD